MPNRLSLPLLAFLAVASAGCPAKKTDGAPDAGGDPCVAACIQQNQMRAVSAEQIEADCRKQCAEETK